jgi:hypothetical protein
MSTQLASPADSSPITPREVRLECDLVMKGGSDLPPCLVRSRVRVRADGAFIKKQSTWAGLIRSSHLSANDMSTCLHRGHSE